MFLVFLFAFCCGVGLAKDPNLARTPQMGFNSWNQFGCNYNETTVHEIADALVSTGLHSVGYQYLNLDDCWMDHDRTASGEWQFAQKRFPSGSQAIVDYVHGKGLKFGLYSSAGPKTCQGHPASLGKEQVDANTLAKWGVDYLKYDNCGSEGISEEEQKGRVKKMGDALTQTGKPIFYSLCEWNGHTGNPFDWVKEIGNSWRTNGDIDAQWQSVMYEADHSDIVWQLAAPGGWNDPDMLEIGVHSGTHLLSDDEGRAHFSLWCLMKAPLLIGADVRNLSPATLATLSNKEAIAISQDKLGVQGHKMQPGPATHPTAGNNIEMYECNSSKPIQRFQWTSGGKQLQLAGTSLCLAVSQTMNPSTHLPLIELQTCTGGAAAQQFHNGTNDEIINTPSGKCVEIAWGSQSQGAVVELNDCNGAKDEGWTTTVGGGIRSLQTPDKCITPVYRLPSKGEIWYGPLSDGVAVILLNRDGPTVNITATLPQMGVKGKVAVRDLWAHQDLGVHQDSITAVVKEHSAAFYKLTPQ